MTAESLSRSLIAGAIRSGLIHRVRERHDKQ